MSNSEGNPVNWRPDANALMGKIRPVALRMESFRLESLAKKKKTGMIGMMVAAVSLPVGFLIMVSGQGREVVGIVVAAVIIFIGFVVYSLIAGNSRKGYAARFKTEFFAEAVRQALPGMAYSPASMIPERSFKESGLFNSRIDRYQGEDCFNGTVGATELIFSELHVEREETSTDSKGRKQTRWVTVFKGIYLIADFHKDFRCRVKIESDVAEANFGWLGRKVQGLSRGLIRLENPDFEKAFKVTSDDPVAARYLLTPDMQERFLELRGKWSPNLSAALIDSSLHLAIPKTEDWFEADMSVPADDATILHGFLIRLMMVLHITETLDLNTRLWVHDKKIKNPRGRLFLWVLSLPMYLVNFVFDENTTCHSNL